MKYSTYVWQAKVFAAMGVLAVLCSWYALWIHNVFLFIVCLLIIWVSVDNFFCGTRLRNAGVKVKGHYAIPPFLKKK